MYISKKKMLQDWMEQIEDCKEKKDYIYFLRLEKIAEYYREKASKNFLKKHLKIGEIYKNKYDNKKYRWDGKIMELVKKDGSISQNIRLNVNFFNFKEWQKI